MFRQARSNEERKDAMRAHPELRSAFAMEALAFQTSKHLHPPEARTAYMQRFRDLITTDLMAGKRLPEVARNTRERREQDVSQNRSR